MNLALFPFVIIICLVFAELSIGAEGGQAKAPVPRGPAVSFRVLGQDLSRSGYTFVTDDKGNARRAHIYATKSWVVIRNAPDPMRIWTLWSAGKFGRVMAEADNQGRGYSASAHGTYLLNLEFARTQARKLQNSLAAARSEGITISPSLAEEIGSALDALKSAEAAKTDVERAQLADAALEKLLFAHEKLVLERARADIERYRKSDVRLQVVDDSGKPIPGVRVQVRQTSRDFLVGHNSMGQVEKYRDKFLGIVNYATLPFYLRGLAPKPHEYQWDPIERNRQWNADHGIQVKGHPLTWFFKGTLPDYFVEMSWDEKAQYCEELTRRNVAHFKGKIDKWDVINEAHGWANLDYPQQNLDDLTERVVRAAREANPDALLVINSCLPLGLYVQWKQSEDVPTPYEYYEKMNKRGVPYDVIGLQMYNGIASPFPTCDITVMSEILDRYARLGKRIHITEFSVPSDASEWGSWHADKWDESTQAEYVQAFYTLAFSKPYVDAITWWCFWDGANWVKNSGVLREDLSEKPAYGVLKRLVESWTTNLEGRTDANGAFSFRGFHGNYEITCTTDAQTVKATAHVGKQPAVASIVLK